MSSMGLPTILVRRAARPGCSSDRTAPRSAARSSGVMPVKSNPTGSASVSIAIVDQYHPTVTMSVTDHAVPWRPKSIACGPERRAPTGHARARFRMPNCRAHLVQSRQLDPKRTIAPSIDAFRKIHSITPSAVARIVGGMANPSALAVIEVDQKIKSCRPARPFSLPASRTTDISRN